MTRYISIILVLLSNICLTQSNFSPYLPFTTNNDCLINIVVSNKKPDIPIIRQAHLNILFHTYTIHNVAGLDFRVSNNNFKNENKLSLKTGYFRLTTKYTKCPIIFLMFTKHNIFETLVAIEKSGFGSSDEVVFFSYVLELTNVNINNVNQIFQLVSRNEVFKPFSATLVFFDLSQQSVCILCYFCDSKFGQLKLIIDNKSLENLKKASFALNSNGNGKAVLLSFQFMEIVTMFIDQFPDTQPSISCLSGFNTYRATLELLLKTINSCNRKILLGISTLQGALNITLTFNTEEILSTNHQWHLQFRFATRIVLPLESLNFETNRGSLHLYLEMFEDFYTAAFCVNYKTYTDYDLQLLTIVDWQVCAALLAIGLLISFITKKLWNGIAVVQISLGMSIDEKTFDRCLFICFLIPLTFYNSIYQSYISSDSTRLKDLPNTLDWYLYENYKLSFPFKQVTEVLYDFVLPDQVKKLFDTQLGFQKSLSFIASEEIQVTNITDMARKMAEKKIGIGNYFEKYRFFTSLLSKNYVLIDGKYACLLRKTSELADTVALRSGFWFSGYMSKKTHMGFSTWMESGEFLKFARLAMQVDSQKRSKQTANVYYLDRAAPPQAIDSESMVGLLCYTICALGFTLLVVGVVLRTLYRLMRWLKRFCERYFQLP